MNKDKEKLQIEERIDQYLNGQLSPDEIDDLWVELIQDDNYLQYMQTSADLRELARQRKAASSAPHRAWMYAAAAAIVLLLVVLGSLRMGVFDSSLTVQPVETIELDYYRSTDAPSDLTDRKKIIRDAIELFNQGEFEKAVDLLHTERNKSLNPAANEAVDASWIAELDIALGTLYYNTDRFNDAVFYFSDVIQNYRDAVEVLTLEKAYWYLGNSYFQLDMLEEAEQAMREAYELNGAYSRVAKSYLDAMADARME